jgi:ketopantoate reductase
MRILVVGAGVTGAEVLRQLSKNPRLTILTLDPRVEPHAVKQGLVAAVDFKEALTPLTLDHVLAQAKPDLILLATSSADLGLGTTAGVDILASAMRYELTRISDVPVVEVAHAASP